MATKVGEIGELTGIVNARTPDGQLRQLKSGDFIYENEIIETSTGASVELKLDNGKIINLPENDIADLDETINPVDERDAVLAEADKFQKELEEGDDLTGDEEPAAGEEDEEHDYDPEYYAGDRSEGQVDSYLFPTQYEVNDEEFEEDGPDRDEIAPDLSAFGVVVDETYIGTSNTATGSITADFALLTGPLVLSAEGAVWDAVANTLTYQQDGTDIWQIKLNQTTGDFEFTQLAAFDHTSQPGPGPNEGPFHNELASWTVTATATYANGQTSTQFTAGIFDDGPAVVAPGYEDEGEGSGRITYDTENIAFESNEEENLDVGGWDRVNIFAVDFGTDGPIDADKIVLGIDGLTEGTDYIWNGSTLTFYQDGVSSNDPTWQVNVAQGPNDTNGNPLFAYVFTQISAVDHDVPMSSNYTDDSKSWTLTATVKDSDEDYVSQTINVTINDDGPSITPTTSDYPDLPDYPNDDGFIVYNPAAPSAADILSVQGDETNDYKIVKTISGQELGIDFGTDGPGSVSLAMAADDPNWEWNPETNTLTYFQDDGAGGEEIAWQMGLQEDSGGIGYWFRQENPINHETAGPKGQDPLTDPHDDTYSRSVNLTVTDDDGDTAGAVISVDIKDDGPEISVGEGANVWADETDDLNVIKTIQDGRIDVDFGTDGEGSIALGLAANYTEGVDYTWDGTILSYYQNGDADTATKASWQIVLTGNAATGYGYQFTQFEAITSHENKGAPGPYPNSYGPHDDSLSWAVTVTAADGDKDTAQGTFQVFIQDDGPDATGFEIKTAELGIAAALPATNPGDVIGMVTGTVAGDFGEDGQGSYAIWDGTEQQSHIEAADGSYEIFMNSETGEWVLYQYEQMDDQAKDATLDFEARIYDSEGDWDSTEVEVPISRFVVGSDPINPGGDNPNYDDDVEKTWDTDTHSVPDPANYDQGPILGEAAADVLVGDPGLEDFDIRNNYVMVMDTSGSMRGEIEDLKTATEGMVKTLHDKVEDSDNGAVKINLLPFNSDAGEYLQVWFEKTGTEFKIFYKEAGQANRVEIADLSDINAWITSHLIPTGGTNYQAGLGAIEGDNLLDPSFNENHIIFFSDGEPNSRPYADILDDLKNHDTSDPNDVKVDSIRAIGLLPAVSAATLNNIDTTGNAYMASDSDEIAGAINEIIAWIDLGPTGSDQIYGNDGNDLIFGDVMNTDGVYADLDGQELNLDLSGIQNLSAGSGWEVFATLEADNPDTWTRTDTIRYIQDHHEDLAQETVVSGVGRDGGHDEIEGGAGDDIIYGQEGNDIIFGEGGDDIIDGGSGNNLIFGDSLNTDGVFQDLSDNHGYDLTGITEPDPDSGWAVFEALEDAPSITWTRADTINYIQENSDTVLSGDGYDTLMISDPGILDFSQLTALSIEKIDMNVDGEDQNITLTLDQVLNMTDADNVLHITGEAGDSVSLTGVGTGTDEWSQDTTNHGLFTHNDTGAQVLIAGPTTDDGVDINVDVDSGTDFNV